MTIFTRQQFENVVNIKAGNRSKTTFLSEARRYSKSLYDTSIFLSHSHTDKSTVEQAVTFFRTLGVDVYVDWMDETMPESTSGETAIKIKSKIRENDKFILLATNSAIKSKWCNWEVGVGDVFKNYDKKLAILPIADNSGQWEGNEYLQIYPRIEKATSNNTDFWVWYPDGSLESIQDWLKKI